LVGCELTSISRSNTAWGFEWLLVLGVAAAIFFSVLNLTSWCGARCSSFVQRERIVLALASGCLAALGFWMVSFGSLPLIGYSIVPVDGWASGPSFMFWAVTFAALLVGILFLLFDLRHKGPLIQVWACHLVIYAILVFEIVYSSARTPPANLVHVVAIGMMVLSSAVISHLNRIEPKPVAGAFIGFLGCIGLFLLPNNAAVIAAERTSILFHLQGISAKHRSVGIPDRSCLRQVDLGEARNNGSEVRGMVVLVIDALRHDVVGSVHQSGTPITPNLDRLSEGAVVFDRAFTAQPTTGGFFRSFGSGSYAQEGGSLGKTLAENDVPFHVIAAHKNVFDSLGQDIVKIPLPSFDHRFDLTSPIVSELAQQQLEILASRFVLLVHYYDPHQYYVPNPIYDFGRSKWNRYLAEVAWTDHHIGSLLKLLPDDVALLVVSDHGEEFREHGYYHHGNRVYNESAQIVALLKAPDTVPQVVSHPVSSIDFAPTILSLLGITIPNNMTGIRLPHAYEGRCVWIKGAEREGVVKDGWKRIWNHRSRTIECYDLDSDPAETTNEC